MKPAAVVAIIALCLARVTFTGLAATELPAQLEDDFDAMVPVAGAGVLVGLLTLPQTSGRS
jgi:hypothetical protein